MKQQHTLQPKLRFPDFEGDLKNVYLKDIAKFSKGKNISKSDIDEDGIFECIRYGELYTTYGEVIENIVSKTNIDKKNLVFSEANDIIIPASGESALDIATASCVIKDGVALGGDLNIIKTKENGVFLSYYFNNKKKYEIAKKSQGISVIHIYSDHLKSLNLNLPSLPEQQKIADYLSTIDTKLNLLEEKKSELTRYKKAMMQKLFSQEIRFKPSAVEALEAYPQWEEKRLGDEIVVKVGATPSTNKKEFWNGNIPWINSGELKDGKIYTPSKYITELGLKNTSTHLLPEGTIVLAMTGATLGKLGILMVESTANQSVAGFIPNSQFKNEYLFYYLMHFQNKIFEKAGGAAQIGINKLNIESLKIHFPSLSEQQKIADFLSAIDSSIEKVNDQITQTQSFKKAMLQQLFV